MTKLHFASTNPGKLREFRSLAAEVGFERASIEPLELDPGETPPEETGSTFAENAILKALHYSQKINGLVFADDSGICVNALGGAPGVHSARFAGESATDAQNLELLRAKMKSQEDRSAHYECVIALADSGRLMGIFEGIVKGLILDDDPRGTGGFGYDPVFFYPPAGLTFAEMSRDDKAAISHRGKAFRRLIEFLT